MLRNSRNRSQRVKTTFLSRIIQLDQCVLIGPVSIYANEYTAGAAALHLRQPFHC